MTGATQAFHSSASGEHYTPAYIADAARYALGAIDLDPASCAEANETIRAERYYTAEDDGLTMRWPGRVLVNAPGTCGLVVCGNAQVCSCRLVSRFWEHLLSEFFARRTVAAIWVGFSVQQFQTLQRSLATPLHFPFCVPDKRVAYCGKSPPHASYIACLGNHRVEDRFHQAFGQIGQIVTPWARATVPARSGAA